MTINELCTLLGGKIFVEGRMDRVVTQATVGDLLSFIMGTAEEGAVWVTIQSHLNVAAVAVLKEIPMIIIASGREPAADLMARCETEGITLLTVQESIFDTCSRMAGLGIVG